MVLLLQQQKRDITRPYWQKQDREYGNEIDDTRKYSGDFELLVDEFIARMDGEAVLNWRLDEERPGTVDDEIVITIRWMITSELRGERVQLSCSIEDLRR